METRDDWAAQLRQLHEMDKSRQQAKEASQSDPEPEVTSEQLLYRSKAHELMRQVQKTLLAGGGKLHFYKDVGGYEHAIVLMWTGPISDAADPATIDDVEASIIVGTNGEGLFVNDTRLPEASEEALRQTLLDVARGFVTE